MAISEKGVKKAKELSGMKSGTLGDDANKIAKFFSQDMTDEEIKQKAKEIFGAAAENMSIDMLKKNIKKDGGKPKLKEGDSTDFGMLSVEACIYNNPKPTQADRIAGATKGEKKKAKGGVRTAIAKIKKAKDGSRTGVRGTGAAKRGFRKARLS